LALKGIIIGGTAPAANTDPTNGGAGGWGFPSTALAAAAAPDLLTLLGAEVGGGRPGTNNLFRRSSSPSSSSLSDKLTAAEAA